MHSLFFFFVFIFVFIFLLLSFGIFIICSLFDLIALPLYISNWLFFFLPFLVFPFIEVLLVFNVSLVKSAIIFPSELDSLSCIISSSFLSSTIFLRNCVRIVVCCKLLANSLCFWRSDLLDCCRFDAKEFGCSSLLRLVSLSLKLPSESVFLFLIVFDFDLEFNCLMFLLLIFILSVQF